MSYRYTVKIGESESLGPFVVDVLREPAEPMWCAKQKLVNRVTRIENRLVAELVAKHLLAQYQSN